MAFGVCFLEPFECFTVRCVQVNQFTPVQLQILHSVYLSELTYMSSVCEPVQTYMQSVAMNQ